MPHTPLVPAGPCDKCGNPTPFEAATPLYQSAGDVMVWFCHTCTAPRTESLEAYRDRQATPPPLPPPPPSRRGPGRPSRHAAR